MPSHKPRSGPVDVFPKVRGVTYAGEITYDPRALDGKTLQMTIGSDGDTALLVGRDVETGKIYILREFTRPI